MRKCLLSSLAVLFFLPCIHAQSTKLFKPFKVDIGVIAINNGMGLFAEPSFSFSGYKLGLRFESAIREMKVIESSSLTVDKYITRTPGFRLFVGGGLGHFSASEAGGCSAGPTGSTVHDTKPFGGLLRTGFEVSHLWVSFEYNFVADTHVTGFDEFNKVVGERVYSSDYLAAKIGIAIGGGRKKRRG